MEVRLDVFQGPLDLLLHLVQRAEVDIFQISVERLARDYLAYLERVPALDLAEASEFLLMAATLLHLKSRSLLPAELRDEGDEEEPEDPRWDLVRQLIEYRKFKAAAAGLADREDAWADWFPQPFPPPGDGPDPSNPVPPDQFPAALLLAAFEELLRRAEIRERSGRIEDEPWTVQGKIDHVLGRLSPGGSLSFAALFTPASSRVEMIVTFLALLELLRTHRVRARQSLPLGDIELQRPDPA